MDRNGNIPADLLVHKTLQKRNGKRLCFFGNCPVTQLRFSGWTWWSYWDIGLLYVYHSAAN